MTQICFSRLRLGAGACLATIGMAFAVPASAAPATDSTAHKTILPPQGHICISFQLSSTRPIVSITQDNLEQRSVVGLLRDIKAVGRAYLPDGDPRALRAHTSLCAGGRDIIDLQLALDMDPNRDTYDLSMRSPQIPALGKVEIHRTGVFLYGAKRVEPSDCRDRSFHACNEQRYYVAALQAEIDDLMAAAVRNLDVR